MKIRLSLTMLAMIAATTVHAAVIDTFTRTDGPDVANSLGQTETGGYSYVERRNFANQSIVQGTAEIRNNQLVLTGEFESTGGQDATGGAYLATDFADVRVGMDLSFQLVTAAPSGPGGAGGDQHGVQTNQFNNTFLLMLRSRPGGNFGGNSMSDDGSVGIELVPNGALQVRQQVGSGAGSLNQLYFGNPVNSDAQTRWPAVDDTGLSLLPTHYGDGTFDLNGNGYLDADEVIRFEAEIVDTSLKVFVNGLQYGPDLTLARSSALPEWTNGIGFHKNRIGGSTQRVGTDVVIDNLAITAIPEPSSLLLVGLGTMFIVSVRRKS